MTTAIDIRDLPARLDEALALASVGDEVILLDGPTPRARLTPPGPAEGGAGETFIVHPDRPPLRVDEGGAVRVGASRVNLDLIVEQYENGMTPEDMCRAYDALAPADVHAAVAYYLRHRGEVRTYVKRRADEAAALREKIEAERPRLTREELLARRGEGEKANAAAGE